MSRLRQEAIQEISSREQKILQQSKVIDTLGTENLLLSQRLADLERAVASMAQNVPVPPDESHESQNSTDPGSSGLNDIGSDLQVGSQAPQVQGPSDATREQCPPKDAALGASGSSSSNPKVAPRAPVSQNPSLPHSPTSSQMPSVCKSRMVIHVHNHKDHRMSLGLRM